IYAELPNVNLVGVADANPSVVNRIAQKWGATPYTNYKEMLAQTQPDAVSIAVPTSLHEKVATDALNAGAHILVEKPIAATIEEGQRLIDLAAAKERQLMVGHIVRFNPAIQLLKQKLQTGDLGKLYQIVCRRIGPFPQRIRDVGVIVDLAPHDIDVMRFLTNQDPIRVYAEIEQRIHTAHEDLVMGTLRFPDGVVGALEINWLTPTKVREVIALGEKGMYRVDDLTQDLYFYENAEAQATHWPTIQNLRGVSEGKMIRYPLKRQEPLYAELKAFIDALDEGKSVPVTGQDGLAALRLSLALVESGQTHQVVPV
ncbi:MAG TPA: Gfo/Idh/MocA family oxidoreductase, partial [Anaerolineae bacterium]|nr:Gfo/Idh/MocA family oxidoreductase [Anaerolineae bacterium]